MDDGRQIAELKTDVAETGASCYLQTLGVDIHDAGIHLIKWDAVFDNVIDSNPIDAIPEAIGLSNPADGSASRITIEAAGTWLYELTVAPAGADATVRGYVTAPFGFGAATFGPFDVVDGANTIAVAGSFTAPDDGIGVFGSVAVTTQAVATADPYEVNVVLALTRIS